MLRTFEAEEEIYKKFKEICVRENTKISDKFNDFMKEYIKIHGSGNPVFTLDNWKNPEFKMYPAFGNPIQDWIDYLQKHPEDAEIVHGHAMNLKRVIEKRFIC